MTSTSSGIKIRDTLVCCDEEYSGLEGGLDDGVEVVGNEVSVGADLVEKSVMKINCVTGGEASNQDTKIIELKAMISWL
ncbi:hypothetical protein PanWU01x14_345750 [Parasponia andersonii]|uniref:Uncharacterized protein n=1 Tax=Parasponia andersonii TaxID=3476 RepID=A0A2P5ACK3_PARAD|nr:hypothetical protein PanWU01x14_345750 [Parasponia andersonii]